MISSMDEDQSEACAASTCLRLGVCNDARCLRDCGGG